MNALLNSSVKYYAYRENYYQWGNGPIYGRFGKIIAKYRRIYKPQLIEFLDLDNKTLFSVIKTKKLRHQFEVRDENNIIKGYIKRKMSFLNILDLNRKKIFTSYIGDLGADFEILNNVGSIIATVKNTEHWREVFKGVMFEFGDIKGVRIFDLLVDRRLIFGIILIMEYNYRMKYIDFIRGPPVPI